MLRVVELLLKVAEDGLMTMGATMCLGTGMVNTPISATLEPLMQELETADPIAYEEMVDALLWGGDNRRLGAILDDAAWCEALGDAVCDLDVEQSTGDWCLGLIVSADNLLSNFDDEALADAARKAVMAAVAVECTGMIADDAETTTGAG